jgi:predicted Zn-dependent protease
MRPDLWLPDRTALGFTDDGTDGIMVSLEPNEARFVLGVTAHEVGHTLGIDHVEPSDFLMKSPMRWENSRRDSKRFEEGDFNTIKTKEAFYVPIQ